MRTRIIPCLQVANERLVKTVQFKIKSYVGDPINTVKIFNDLQVDELCILDIRATSSGSNPDLNLLHQIADECLMPLSYGGAVNCLKTAKTIFSIGFEKVIINTAAVRDPNLIREISTTYGSQAVIASIDVKKSMFGKYNAFTNNAKMKLKLKPVEWAQHLERLGAGEILLTSVDRDGTWEGYDIQLTKQIANAVNIPVIANGGAGNCIHIKDVITNGNASAAAVGSMFIFQNKSKGVLINYPAKDIYEIVHNK